MVYSHFEVFLVILWCQSAWSSPIGEVNVSFSKSVSNPTDNSVYDGEEFADVSNGYKKDEAVKVGSCISLTSFSLIICRFLD